MSTTAYIPHNRTTWPSGISFEEKNATSLPDADERVLFADDQPMVVMVGKDSHYLFIATADTVKQPQCGLGALSFQSAKAPPNVRAMLWSDVSRTGPARWGANQRFLAGTQKEVSRKERALALLDAWLAEEPDLQAEEESLRQLKLELDSDRKGHRQLFPAKNLSVNSKLSS